MIEEKVVWTTEAVEELVEFVLDNNYGVDEGLDLIEEIEGVAISKEIVAEFVKSVCK
jgi:hypothetical protein